MVTFEPFGIVSFKYFISVDLETDFLRSTTGFTNFFTTVVGAATAITGATTGTSAIGTFGATTGAALGGAGATTTAGTSGTRTGSAGTAPGDAGDSTTTEGEFIMNRLIIACIEMESDTEPNPIHSPDVV